MGEFQAMHKYFALFLALDAFNYSVLANGRQIKQLNQHSSQNTDTTSARHRHNPHPTLSIPTLKTNSNIPTTLAEQKVDSSISIPKYNVAGVGDSGADHANAFRPTTPGSSPGVGHKKFAVAEDEGMKKAMVVVQSPNVKVHVTEGFENYFRPTVPGHSPGVGHAHQDQN